MEKCKKIPREWRPWVTRHLPCQHFSAEFLMWYSTKILDTNPFDKISLWISKKKHGRYFKLASKRKIVQLNSEKIVKLSLTNSYKQKSLTPILLTKYLKRDIWISNKMADTTNWHSKEKKKGLYNAFLSPWNWLINTVCFIIMQCSYKCSPLFSECLKDTYLHL